MSGGSRIERRMPAILSDLGAGPYPDYTDTILARTAAARQRPGWLFPERWLPLSTAYTATAATSRIPWRAIGAVALLLLALVAGALVIAGNQPRVIAAPPFGPAANGLLAYAKDGDIYISDPLTGVTRAIVSGPDADRGPVWSRDGTRLVFVRQVFGEGADRLFVARPDGSGSTEITVGSFRSIGDYSFSPDGRDVLFVSDSESEGTMHIAAVDGSGVRTLDIGIGANHPAFRPPDGKQIAFTGSPSGQATGSGIYVVDLDGGDLRTLVEPASSAGALIPLWSPDGSRIAYSQVPDAPEWKVHTRVMAADGSGDRALPMPDGAQFNYEATWSNDGTRLVTMRGYAISGHGDNVAAIVPADGSGPGIETARSLFPDQGLSFEWAPDDTSILVIQRGESDEVLGAQVLDPLTGEIRSAPNSITSRAAWQRLAPSR